MTLYLKSGLRNLQRLAFAPLLLFCTTTILGQQAARQPAALPVLTQVRQVRRLSPREGALNYPVRLRVVVTYFDPFVMDLFVQDATEGIWVNPEGAKLDLKPGQLIELEGIGTAGDFAPQIEKPRVRVLGHASMPAARRVSFDRMASGAEDSQWVEVTGIVRAATMIQTRLALDVAVEGGRVRAYIPQFKGGIPPHLVDSQVLIHGVCGTQFNSKNQLLGVLLFVPGLETLTLEQAVPADPFEAPVRTIGSILRFSPQAALGHRVRVQGVVTLQRGGGSFFIKDETQGVYVQTRQAEHLELGDKVDVAGFPALGENAPVLEDGVFRRIGKGTLPPPAVVTADRALSGDFDADLVRLNAQLVSRVHPKRNQILILQEGNLSFRAEMEERGEDDTLSFLRSGSQVQLTGICTAQIDEGRETHGFRLLLRSPRDVVVLHDAPWWTVSRAMLMLGLTGLLILVAVGWVEFLRRRVQSKTETIRAALESTADGIVVVDAGQKIVTFNHKFAEMWSVPESILVSRDRSRFLTHIAAQVKEPEAFLVKVRQLSAAPDAQSDDVLELQDGRLFERHSEPQRIGGKSRGSVFGFRDITERRRAEIALRNSETRYRLLYERSPVGVCLNALDGTILECNPTYARILGYDSTEDVRSHKAGEFYDRPFDRQVMIERLWEQRALLNVETCLRRKDGEAVWVLQNLTLMQEPGGAAAVVHGTLMDITERKRSERRLATQHATARVLSESSTVGEATPKILHAICEALEWEYGAFWFLDRQAQVLRWMASWQAPSTRFAEFEGASRKINFPLGVGLPGQAWAAAQPVWIPDVSQNKDFQRGVVAAKEGLHAAIAFPIVLGSDTLGVMEFFTREIRRPDDDLLQLLSTLGSQIAQFMERKRAEEGRQQSEEQSRVIVDTALDAVLTMDLEGRITGWNAQAEKIFDWSREQALGRKLAETIIPSRYRDAHDAGLKRFLSTGEGAWLNQRIEVFALHRDGHEFPVELSISPARIGSGWVFSAFIRDITERKRAEAELKEAKDHAESASRAKSEFLANMSHEMRTPMNGVIGMTELALDTSLSREQREYLGMVKESADSLLKLIDDILDFSKIEAGKLDLELAPFDLEDNLANAIKSLAPRAHQKGLELAYQIRPDVPQALVGDPGRLRQIILNLVANAIKFTERGEVIVDVKVESLTPSEAQLCFAVTDTGIGIPVDKQKMIFEAFEQADGSTTRKYGGTGLGLAISSRLAALLNGRLWVESTVGKGSTFHFAARFGVQQTPTAWPALGGTFTLQGLPVLVIDDNATNRGILDAMLRHWKMQPVLAEDGGTGFEVMKQRKEAGKTFPLVLMDAQMPGMDGFTLARKIQQDAKLAGAVLMMLTSAGQHDDAARCKELGIAAYLIKPIRQSEMLEAILAALGQPLLQGSAPRLVTRHSLRESPHKFHILLAEDNRVNRELAVRLLEKRGFTVQVAAHGREALAALEEQRFDLLLMDVQMPEMDGFEATAAIREKEKATGAHLPIIAMTAHAMKGDRERCLQAGMDGYISKPIQSHVLFQTIESLRRAPVVAQTGLNPAGHTNGILVKRAALARVEGDRELLRELVGLFFGEWPRLSAELRKAVLERDARVLGRAAHTLKSSLANFGVEEALKAAEILEHLAREGDLTHVDAAFAILEKEVEDLKPVLAGLAEVGAP